ncbi:hypothetical protein C8F04DRAFT_1267964 [Mycena alexandri]|uniref:Uncharacterized protein n=1 Tax=Mycena alexandri TaxID=1745969 RepID=A0AAD6SEQ8_9AGAR|nr:hypothetical protein C8F04DRAFT_1267964 [Mycena alexandri]
MDLQRGERYADIDEILASRERQSREPHIFPYNLYSHQRMCQSHHTDSERFESAWVALHPLNPNPKSKEMGTGRRLNTLGADKNMPHPVCFCVRILVTVLVVAPSMTADPVLFFARLNSDAASLNSGANQLDLARKAWERMAKRRAVIRESASAKAEYQAKAREHSARFCRAHGHRLAQAQQQHRATVAIAKVGYDRWYDGLERRLYLREEEQRAQEQPTSDLDEGPPIMPPIIDPAIDPALNFDSLVIDPALSSAIDPVLDPPTREQALRCDPPTQEQAPRHEPEYGRALECCESYGDKVNSWLNNMDPPAAPEYVRHRRRRED